MGEVLVAPHKHTFIWSGPAKPPAFDSGLWVETVCSCGTKRLEKV